MTSNSHLKQRRPIGFSFPSTPSRLKSQVLDTSTNHTVPPPSSADKIMYPLKQRSTWNRLNFQENHSTRIQNNNSQATNSMHLSSSSSPALPQVHENSKGISKRKPLFTKPSQQKRKKKSKKEKQTEIASSFPKFPMPKQRKCIRNTTVVLERYSRQLVGEQVRRYERVFGTPCNSQYGAITEIVEKHEPAIVEFFREMKATEFSFNKPRSRACRRNQIDQNLEASTERRQIQRKNAALDKVIAEYERELAESEVVEPEDLVPLRGQLPKDRQDFLDKSCGGLLPATCLEVARDLNVCGDALREPLLQLTMDIQKARTTQIEFRKRLISETLANQEAVDDTYTLVSKMRPKDT